MSELSDVNRIMRIDVIKILLKHHPVLIDMLLTQDHENFNVEATPEKLDLNDRGDMLVRLAWDFWNGAGDSEFDSLLNQLAQDDFEAFAEAVALYSKLRRKVMAIYASGAEND